MLWLVRRDVLAGLLVYRAVECVDRGLCWSVHVDRPSSTRVLRVSQRDGKGGVEKYMMMLLLKGKGGQSFTECEWGWGMRSGVVEFFRGAAW